MVKSETVKIELDKINIPAIFKRDLPNNRKISARYSFYKKTGSFDREILIDENNNLLDGYTTYLVCKMVGIEKVRVLRINVNFSTNQLLNMLREQIDRDFARKVCGDG
jgi:hypothetical protein